MNIIVPKRTIVFSNHGQAPAGVDADGKVIFKAVTRQQLTVTPGPGMQVVPDWVRDTVGWKACVKDGSVVEIGAPVAQVPVLVEKRPPTIEEVLAAGYKGTAAASIVAEEQRKYDAGEFPYPAKEAQSAPKRKRTRAAASADATVVDDNTEDSDDPTAQAENAGSRDDNQPVIDSQRVPPGFKSQDPALQVKA